MNNRAETVLSAIRLVKLGEELEAARAELKRLVESGAAWESEEMKTALQKCLSLDSGWRALEQKHLALVENAEKES